MSSLAQLTALITNLTNRFNLLETNAKKVEELPVQTILNANSKIPVSNNGNSEYITVQQIIDSAEISNENHLLSVESITVAGTDIIVESGLSGIINGILYSISSDITIPISLCDNGFNRKDILVLTRNNTVISISGEETNGSIVIAPPTPIDTAYITTFDVSDSNIGLPEDPIEGSEFLKKSFAYYFNTNISGAGASIPFDAAGKTEIRLTNSALQSIASVDITAWNDAPNPERFYPGKPYLLRNLTGTAITIAHNATLTGNIQNQRPTYYPFDLKEGQDLILPNNEAILFHFTDGKMVEIFRSWSLLIQGTQYTYVAGNGTPTENGTELQNAYNLAKTIVGLSATNRFKIIVGTGKYTVTGQFLIDTQYIDFVSLTGDADVEITNGIYVTANDVYLKGIKTNAQLLLSSNLSLLVCDTCIGLGNYSFASYTVISGTFINCIGDYGAFAGSFSIASGTFINCIGGEESFGNAAASGTFNNCRGGIESFSYLGNTSGTFTNCIGGDLSFGVYGTLTGKLYYCRLTSGTFKTVSSGGRTYYCVDGNGNTNNQ